MHLYSIEYAAALKENGGLSIEGHPFLKVWQNYKQKKDSLPELPKLLDKRTSSTVLNILNENGSIKRSVLQIPGKHGKLVQIPVIYLAEIGLDSPEMKAFARSLQDAQVQTGQKQKWLDGRKVLEVDGTITTSRSSRLKQEERIDVGDDPRAYFQQEWRAIAQLYGWKYGVYARARTLHGFLVSSITDENDSLFISSSRPEARIFSPQFVKEDIPLSTFLSIVATHRHADELDNFLAENDGSKALVSQLPQNLRLAVCPPTEGFHKDRIFPLLDVLVNFRLVIPLEISDEKTEIVAYSGQNREPRHFRPRKLRGAKYLMLANKAPMYDLEEKEPLRQRLLGELSIANTEQAEIYWDALKNVVFGKTLLCDLSPASADYPAHLDVPAPTNKSMRIASHWYGSYILLRGQKTYIKRILKEKGMLETIGSEEAIKKLALDVCGREDEVRRYAVSVAAQSRRLRAVRAKANRPVKNTSKRAERDGEDVVSATDGSEVSEASGAELGMPKRRGKPRKKVAQRKLKLAQTASDQAEAAEEQPVRAPARSVADVLARKAQPVDGERARLWEGIHSRFIAEHGEDAISTEQIAFLKNWFLSPGGISVPALQEHLETMAEDSSALKFTTDTRKQTAGKPGRKKRGDAAEVVQKVEPEQVPDVSFSRYALVHKRQRTDLDSKSQLLGQTVRRKRSQEAGPMKKTISSATSMSLCKLAPTISGRNSRPTRSANTSQVSFRRASSTDSGDLLLFTRTRPTSMRCKQLGKICGWKLGRLADWPMKIGPASMAAISATIALTCAQSSISKQCKRPFTSNTRHS